MKVRNMACGENHTVAQVSSSDKGRKVLMSWGLAKSGQLGLGESEPQTSAKIIKTLFNTHIQEISAGSNTTLAVLGDPSNLEQHVMEYTEESCAKMLSHSTSHLPNFELKLYDDENEDL